VTFAPTTAPPATSTELERRLRGDHDRGAGAGAHVDADRYVDPGSLGLDRLVGHRGYPSVSLLVALDPASGPWRARLDALERNAEARLDLEAGHHDVETVKATLRAAVDRLQPDRSAVAVAVYVSGDSATVLSLPVDVRDRVVIDHTFATRDVVHALNRSPRWWLLALDVRRPRLLVGAGVDLQPVPLGLDDDAGADDIGRPERRRRNAGDDRRFRRLRRLRDVAEAVAAAVPDRDAPLVVVGVEPTVSQFAQLAAPRRLAVVRSSPRAGRDELAQVAAGELRRLDDERRAEALAALDRHLAAGRCATGLHAAWEHAHRGGGAVVLVESGYEYPARVAGDGTLVPAHDRDAPAVVDDAVDELIEAVLARGGRSHVLPDGTLAHVGRVALLARHPVTP
jgi:hypothetical protein